MARIGLRARLAKLEKHRRKQSPNRVLNYNPADLTDSPVCADLPVWRVGYWQSDEDPARGPLRAFAGRFMLASDFGTMAEWEAAARKQQRELLTVDHKHCNESVAEAPVIVGTFYDVEAPKRKGMKGQRFIELADGRTFDTETRQYVDEDGKPIAKAGGLSAEWKR